MADVFVSYKREDQALALEVVSALQGLGYTTWWDQRITPKEAWDATIQKEIDAAKAVLVLWTAASVKSDWVRIEATYAKENKKLVPARLEHCRLPVAFVLTQTSDLTHWKGEAEHPEWLRTLSWIADIAGPPTDGVSTSQPNIELRALQTENRALREQLLSIQKFNVDLNKHIVALDADRKALLAEIGKLQARKAVERQIPSASERKSGLVDLAKRERARGKAAEREIPSASERKSGLVDLAEWGGRWALFPVEVLAFTVVMLLSFSQYVFPSIALSALPISDLLEFLPPAGGRLDAWFTLGRGEIVSTLNETALLFSAAVLTYESGEDFRLSLFVWGILSAVFAVGGLLLCYVLPVWLSVIVLLAGFGLALAFAIDVVIAHRSNLLVAFCALLFTAFVLFGPYIAHLMADAPADLARRHS
ncbi:MAG: TIR domain-containing protein [Hyphomonadaceae bacterium]